MKVSIIIVSWNVKDYLKPCLEVVYQTIKGINFEIFVVDNNSKDGTVEFVKEYFPQVKLIVNEGNPGFAKANNQAIVRSKGKYILLLNPDTVVLPNSITTMVKFMDQHANFGAVGPAILFEDMQTVSLCGARKFPSITESFLNFTILNRVFKIFSKNETKWEKCKDHVREVDVLSGACMLVRKKAIEEVGLLDENFFMYGEDVDWCYRIKKAGWKLYYLPSVGIVHYGERSAIQKYSETENMIQTLSSNFKYFRKQHGKLYAGSYKAMVIFVALLANCYWKIKFFVSSRNKNAKIKGILNRNKEFIKWGLE